MFNAQPFVDRVRSIVRSHSLGNGGYAQFTRQNKAQDRELGINAYGCADAANILYTIGELPKGEEAARMVAAMQGLQDEKTGLFYGPAHHPIHTTAHVVAALELFDAKPLYPLKDMEPYFTVEGMTALLDSLSSAENPWSISHRGAGIYAAGVLTDSVTPEWEDAYFRWFRENADSFTGISLKGAITPQNANIREYFRHLYGWFHYLFNHEYAHRPFPCVERTLNTLMDLYRWNLFGPDFGTSCGFREIDVVYVTSRCMRKTSHHFDDAMKYLRAFAEKFLPAMDALDPETDEGMDDLHRLFGTLCAVAELQSVLPGEVYTEKPLHLVLDRRPFI